MPPTRLDRKRIVRDDDDMTASNGNPSSPQNNPATQGNSGSPVMSTAGNANVNNGMNAANQAQMMMLMRQQQQQQQAQMQQQQQQRTALGQQGIVAYPGLPPMITPHYKHYIKIMYESLTPTEKAQFQQLESQRQHQVLLARLRKYILQNPQVTATLAQGVQALKAAQANQAQNAMNGMSAANIQVLRNAQLQQQQQLQNQKLQQQALLRQANPVPINGGVPFMGHQAGGRFYHFAETPETILKKYENESPSLILHIHPSHFRFGNQETVIPKNSPLMKMFFEYVANKAIPPAATEVFADSGIKYYEGNIILQIVDHRAIPQTSDSHDENSDNKKKDGSTEKKDEEPVKTDPDKKEDGKEPDNQKTESPSTEVKKEGEGDGDKSENSTEDKGKGTTEGGNNVNQQKVEPKVIRTVLRPTPLSMWHDMLYFTDFSQGLFTDQVTLNIESEILKHTRRNLDLTVPKNPYNSELAPILTYQRDVIVNEYRKKNKRPWSEIKEELELREERRKAAAAAKAQDKMDLDEERPAKQLKHDADSLSHLSKQELLANYKFRKESLHPPRRLHEDLMHHGSEYEELMLIMSDRPSSPGSTAASAQLMRLSFMEQVRKKFQNARMQQKYASQQQKIAAQARAVQVHAQQQQQQIQMNGQQSPTTFNGVGMTQQQQQLTRQQLLSIQIAAKQQQKQQQHYQNVINQNLPQQQQQQQPQQQPRPVNHMNQQNSNINTPVMSNAASPINYGSNMASPAANSMSLNNTQPNNNPLTTPTLSNSQIPNGSVTPTSGMSMPNNTNSGMGSSPGTPNSRGRGKATRARGKPTAIRGNSTRGRGKSRAGSVSTPGAGSPPSAAGSPIQSSMSINHHNVAGKTIPGNLMNNNNNGMVNGMGLGNAAAGQAMRMGNNLMNANNNNVVNGHVNVSGKTLPGASRPTTVMMPQQQRPTMNLGFNNNANPNNNNNHAHVAGKTIPGKTIPGQQQQQQQMLQQKQQFFSSLGGGE